MRNPLIKRVPKELVGDWQKYLVIIIFLVMMIGIVSGMYVGHDSMLAAIEDGRVNLNLEDGSFELNKKASAELLDAIEKGDMADVRQHYIDEGIAEADREVADAIEDELDRQVRAGIEEAVRAQCEAYGIADEEMIQAQIDAAIEENYEAALAEARESDEFLEAAEEAYEEAHEAVIDAVDEEWDRTAEKYELNDDNFEAVPVTVYENFFRDADEDIDNDDDTDATIRVFRSTDEINQASFIDGRAPETDDEIAIDRMHADNVGVKTGDTITVGDREFRIVGLLSYVDYLTLHESNKDLMFDSFGFDVGMVTPEAFNSLKARIHYNYAYLYENKPEDKVGLSDVSENFLKALITQTVVYDNEIENYLPEYLRQSSNFAPSDIESDTTGTIIFCYILIAVIAFIFAITISNTIEKEASVIGTLRASGYTKGELIAHYMSMPFIVTVIGAIIGNILGYTAFKNVAVNLYYNSYSMPSCGLVWSPDALIKTTVIPLVLMFFVNLFVIIRKLQLRHDLKKIRRSKARRLPSWSFLRRFRLRILFQNVPNYIILIFGVIFVEIMLCFAFGFPDSLSYYAQEAPDMLFAKYQYVLMSNEDDDGNAVVTAEPSAERFCATELMFPRPGGLFREGFGSGGDESVTVYGIFDSSRYVDIDSDLEKGEVYISSAFASKYGLSEGDMMTLSEEYENSSYDFTVAGVTDYDGGIAIFMPSGAFNSIFGKDDDYFSGYFADAEITDIDENDIASVITVEDITKVTTQLQHSMGQFFNIFQYGLVILAASLIYLLTKIIIERNENAISMVKILGFQNKEIGSLYMIPTALIVVIFTFISFIAGYFIVDKIFDVFILQMDGYFSYYMSPKGMGLAVICMIIGYAIVSIFDYMRIKRIPMDQALKNVE